MAVSIKLKFKKSLISEKDLSTLVDKGFDVTYNKDNEIELEAIYLVSMLIAGIEKASELIEDMEIFPVQMSAIEFNLDSYLDKSQGLVYIRDDE